MGKVAPETHAELTVKEKAEPDITIDDGSECPKCHKKSVVEKQVQVRSGDEGTNTMFRCTNRSCDYVRIGR